MAAAVGQTNPLDENAGTAIQMANAPSNGIHSITKPIDLPVSTLNNPTTPYAALMYNIEQFANSQLKKVQELTDTFFNLYENVLIDDRISMDEVIQAHSNLIVMIDQLLSTATQSGFSGLACPSEGELIGSSKAEDISMTDLQDKDRRNDQQDDINARFSAQSKEAYERRERLRESASMITNILAHSV